jgi:hypothetical protein
MQKIAKGWPPERRKKQAERIRNQQPWKQSTGPRTETGRVKTARNAYKHGFRSTDMERVRALLRARRALVKRALLEARNRGVIEALNGD